MEHDGTTVPEIEATFGFVDLAGFTALTEAHGDSEADGYLQRFEAITRSALASSDHLVKTIGDAVMLTFPGPDAAVRAICRLFHAAGAEPGLPVLRAGLHHGTAIERDGDYFGAAVNLAARVAGQAQGRQVLATAGVAQGARRAGVTVVDLGAFDLHNISQPVELFDLEVCPSAAGSAIDPVCRMPVARTQAAGRLRHHHADYWFCSLRCVAAFTVDPDRYTERVS